MKRKKLSNAIESFVFLGPATLVFSISVVIPFLLSIGYSLTDWNGVSNTIHYVGLQNFIDIFSGKSGFFESCGFTFQFAAVSVVLTNCIGLALALALTTNIKSRNFLRAVFYLPNTMGGIVLGFIWRFIFVAGFAAIGRFTNMALFSLPWLGTEGTAFFGLVIVNVWQNTGYVMVIMTAALVGIPGDQLEAAKIDGAGFWKTLFRIKLPACMPYITFCLFWTISNSLKVFDVIVSLTRGGPYGYSTSLALSIYNHAFSNNKYGLATAESVIFFIILFAVTSVQMYLSRKKEEKLL